jgi:hypothetical protein
LFDTIIAPPAIGRLGNATDLSHPTAHQGWDCRGQLLGGGRDWIPALGQCANRMGRRAAGTRRLHALTATIHPPGIRGIGQQFPHGCGTPAGTSPRRGQSQPKQILDQPANGLGRFQIPREQLSDYNPLDRINAYACWITRPLGLYPVTVTRRSPGEEHTGRTTSAPGSDPAFDTADFADTAPGIPRGDYGLPHKILEIVAAAVFWPTSADLLFAPVGLLPFTSSDHRLVWIDARILGPPLED